jgi:hypothetical protein
MKTQNATTETLQEFVDSRGLPLRADKTKGVIYGVKILGGQSRNGRLYPSETLSQAAGLYEEAKVNVNHPKGDPNAPRDYQDRIGTVRNVVARRDEGLFADFHFNPKHVLAEQLLWDAEHSPENVGFSHNVEARVARQGDRVVVEAITRVRSVDLVADPATTRGLFESQENPAGDPNDGELERLRGEVERLRLQEESRNRRDAMETALREFHLPQPDATDPLQRAITSRRFVELLLASGDRQTMRELIEDRSVLVRALAEGSDESGAIPVSGESWDQQRNARSFQPRKPVCRDQHVLDELKSLDTKLFVESITK